MRPVNAQSATTRGAATRWQRLDKSQLLKWTVYSLLLFNWVFYGIEEWQMATYTLRDGGSLFDWTEAFATTIDNLGWFGLLLAFELETYVLEDDAFERRPWLPWMLHGIRVVCYALLLHTVVARVDTVRGVFAVPQAEGMTSPCEVAGQEISWGRNFDYTLITRENCASLSTGDTLYWLEPTVLTDADGLALEKKHVLVDLSDVLAWLFVAFSIELAVWLQNRDITGGPLMVVSHAAKFFYALLFGHMAWWIWTGHWVWGWDQFVWIAGFWAIENNVSEWREGIVHEHTVDAHGNTGPP